MQFWDVLKNLKIVIGKKKRSVLSRKKKKKKKEKQIFFWVARPRYVEGIYLVPLC